MNVFEYFKEEHRTIVNELDELIRNYSKWSRERVFDEVKLVCDAINGHLRKEEELLLQNVAENSRLSQEIAASNTDRAHVKEELGQLISVHVDEPEYPEFLDNLRDKFTEHAKHCEELCSTVQKQANPNELSHINTQLQYILVSAAGYNQIQPGM